MGTCSSSNHSLDSSLPRWARSVRRRTWARTAGWWWLRWPSWGCANRCCRSHCAHCRAWGYWPHSGTPGSFQGWTRCCSRQYFTLVWRSYGQRSHCETHFLSWRMDLRKDCNSCWYYYNYCWNCLNCRCPSPAAAASAACTSCHGRCAACCGVVCRSSCCPCGRPRPMVPWSWSWQSWPDLRCGCGLWA